MTDIKIINQAPGKLIQSAQMFNDGEYIHEKYQHQIKKMVYNIYNHNTYDYTNCRNG